MSADGPFRDEAPDDLPPGISKWPYQDRIEQVQKMHTRQGIIMQLLNRANYPVEGSIEQDHHLTKEELAAIYLLIRGVHYERK